jgi:two-component system, OmpR family, sensor histidine kinase QseC
VKSIRTFLVCALLAVITLVSFIAIVNGYSDSMREARDLFNGQLEKQLVWLDEIAAGAAEQQPRLPALQTTNGSLLFQIWSADGRTLISRSVNAPDTPLAPLHEGFHDITHDGLRWNGLTRKMSSSGHIAIIADRADLRFQLAENVINKAVYPIVIAIPLLGIMIWFIVNAGLSPVIRIADELRLREASDLRPLELSNVPRELKLLTHSANELLRRLEASFAREKRFASDAAHELRTPIAALTVHIDNTIAAMPERADQLKPLRDGIERLSYLVEQILLLNRTVPDAYMAKFTTVDLYDIAKRVVERDMGQILSHHHELEVNGQSATLQGDAFALETLLHNLLGNAIKYTPDHGHILLRFFRSGSEAVVEITDTGPGIAQQERNRVFERFYRVGGDQHGTGLIGCGLGLAIVKHIVDMHRGTITLGDAHWGTGLCVTVHLPVSRDTTATRTIRPVVHVPKLASDEFENNNF